MNLAKSILDMFKKKGVELTAEEAVEFASIGNTETTIDTQDIKHNKKFLDDMKANIDASMLKAQEGFSQQITMLQEENKNLLAALAEEKTQRENVTKITLERAESEKQTQINNLIEEAKKDGRIPMENLELQEKYKEILTLSFDNGKLVLDSLPKAIKSDVTTKVIPSIQVAQSPMEAYLSEFKVNETIK